MSTRWIDRRRDAHSTRTTTCNRGQPPLISLSLRLSLSFLFSSCFLCSLIWLCTTSSVLCLYTSISARLISFMFFFRRATPTVRRRLSLITSDRMTLSELPKFPVSRSDVSSAKRLIGSHYQGRAAKRIVRTRFSFPNLTGPAITLVVQPVVTGFRRTWNSLKRFGPLFDVGRTGRIIWRQRAYPGNSIKISIKLLVTSLPVLNPSALITSSLLSLFICKYYKKKCKNVSQTVTSFFYADLFDRVYRKETNFA